mmetsp:Transcript_15922/g.50798  ORF Transcript_15922/g.50798 Transcript_15922/m.50798 type:complete len:814 (+) Transcript_15922:58-2499(+)
MSRRLPKKRHLPFRSRVGSSCASVVYVVAAQACLYGGWPRSGMSPTSCRPLAWLSRPRALHLWHVHATVRGVGKDSGLTARAVEARDGGLSKWRAIHQRRRDVWRMRRQLVALLAEDNRTLGAALDSGVPALYNVTLGPGGVPLPDVKELPAKFSQVGDQSFGGADSVVSPSAFRHDLERHASNLQLLRSGDSVAFSLQASHGSLKKGDVILIPSTVWRGAVVRNTAPEASLPAVGVSMLCDVYDADGRHTQADQRALRVAAASGMSRAARALVDGRWLNSTEGHFGDMSLPGGLRDRVRSILRRLSQEAVVDHALDRARCYDFLSNRPWRLARGRLRWLEQFMAASGDWRLRSSTVGLFYTAPAIEVICMERQWHFLPQLVKLQLNSLAENLQAPLEDDAGRVRIESCINRLEKAIGMFNQARQRQDRVGTTICRDATGCRVALFMVLLARLVTVKRNLVTPGLFEALDADGFKLLGRILDKALPIFPLATSLTTADLLASLPDLWARHSDVAKLVASRLEVAYWCLFAPWTPMMYIVPAAYKVSSLGATIINTFSLHALVVSVVHVCRLLSDKIWVIRKLFEFLYAWVLTPALSSYVMLSDIFRTVFRPIFQICGRFASVVAERERAFLAGVQALLRSLGLRLRLAWHTLVRPLRSIYARLRPLVLHISRISQAVQASLKHVQTVLGSGLKHRLISVLHSFRRLAGVVSSPLRALVLFARKLAEYPNGLKNRLISVLRSFRPSAGIVRSPLRALVSFARKLAEYPNVAIQALRRRQRRASQRKEQKPAAPPSTGFARGTPTEPGAGADASR